MITPSHQDHSYFSKLEICFPLSLTFCWNGLEKGNWNAFLCGKQLNRVPRSLEIGKVSCQMLVG